MRVYAMWHVPHHRPFLEVFERSCAAGAGGAGGTRGAGGTHGAGGTEGARGEAGAAVLELQEF